MLNERASAIGYRPLCANLPADSVGHPRRAGIAAFSLTVNGTVQLTNLTRKVLAVGQINHKADTALGAESGPALKRFLRPLRDGRPWLSGHSTLLLHQIYNRQLNAESGFSDQDHLIATAKWLETAQDVTSDGGVCGRYSLGKGWTSSYPETTGYIVPTFLNLAKQLGDSRFVSRANAAVDFLLGIQLPDGGFPGLEIADNRTQPSPFNTAQIIHGLVAWHSSSGDERALTAACRAGDWILSNQDGDGAWRRHCYNNVASTYTAHLSCWLTQLGHHVGDDRYKDAAARHVEWILGQRDPETGWIDLAGFDEHQHKARIAYTHTIAYTLFGLLYTSCHLGLTDGISAVEQAANAIARRLELSKSLPGILDHRWRSYSPAACLTGNAQMAIIWFELYERNGDARLINAAFKALDLVKLAQPMTNRNAAIRGGVPGSDPVWGSYLYMAIPNWSAKFYIDALLKKREVLETLDSRPLGHLGMPNDVPTALPAKSSPILPRRCRAGTTPLKWSTVQSSRALPWHRVAPRSSPPSV